MSRGPGREAVDLFRTIATLCLIMIITMMVEVVLVCLLFVYKNWSTPALDEGKIKQDKTKQNNKKKSQKSIKIQGGHRPEEK